MTKIAIVSNDGHTISAHFGRATQYVVFTVEGGEIVGREVREKLGHNQFADEEGHGDQGPGHGFSPAAQSRHGRMIANIMDCQMVVARGMGTGAYHSLQAAGIRPLVTDLRTVEEAVQAYLQGRLVDHPERLH